MTWATEAEVAQSSFNLPGIVSSQAQRDIHDKDSATKDNLPRWHQWLILARKAEIDNVDFFAFQEAQGCQGVFEGGTSCKEHRYKAD